MKQKYQAESDVAIKYSAAAAIGFVLASISIMAINPSASEKPIFSAIAGALSGLVIPFWQTYFVNRSRLTLEISSISRKVSKKSEIYLDEHSEFSVLKQMSGDDQRLLFLMNENNQIRKNSRGVSIEKLDELFLRSKQELKDLPGKIEERKTGLGKVQACRVDSFSEYDCAVFNRPIRPEVVFNKDNKDETLAALNKAYQERLNSLETRYTDLQAALPAIERKIEAIKENLINNNSYFEISVTLINSGRLNTSVKRPALLRVYIGEGNYVDLKLALIEFEVKSQVAPNSTLVAVFESADISQLPEEDKKLINTYWGQSVSSVLFVEDVHNKIYKSQPIAFAEGLYQKIIYDRLAAAASGGLI